MIAKETGYDEDTVYACLRSLDLMGYVSRVQMSDKGTGRFGSNVYQLFQVTPFEGIPKRTIPGLTGYGGAGDGAPRYKG